MTHENEHPLLKSARKEAIAALSIWLVVVTYCVWYCSTYGYMHPDRARYPSSRDPASLTYIFGFPDWIFWGIVIPWLVCTIVSGLFAFFFMKDEDLDN